MMRKTRRRAIALLMAASMVLMAGCSSKSAGTTAEAEGKTDIASETAVAGGYQEGSYTAVGKGMGGEIEILVTFSKDAITEVKVGKHNETPGIGDAPIEKIPAAIVKNQSLMIDAVSGATITSDAILSGVADCVKQAGGDVEALKAKAVTAEKEEDEILETDVVVVGAGMAGLSAAIDAADSGAKVILLEKMGAVGGSSITCGGEILAAETELQKSQGITDSAKDLGDYWIKKGEGHVNEEMLRFIADHNAESITWLIEQGVVFSGVTTPTSMPWQDPMRCHKTESGNGAGFILPLAESAKQKGVEIRLDTPVVSLINTDGTITGVVAENAGRKVTVHADSVILATGGFGNNAELMKEYSPKVPISGVLVGVANQGDGLLMAREAGANIVAGGGAIALSIDMGPTGYFEPYGQFLYVSPDGKRFMNEAEYWFARTRKLYDMGGYCYAITDSKTKNDNWGAAVAAGTAWKADSLEKLAEQLKMDEAVLNATVTTYNGYCKSGTDEEFGKPASRTGMELTQASTKENPGMIKQEEVEMSLLNSIEEGPFYAIKLELNSLSGTFGGPQVTLSGEVIHTDGHVISGLYAAGEVANGELLYQEYPCSGSAIQMYCRMGRLAGEAAAKHALEK